MKQIVLPLTFAGLLLGGCANMKKGAEKAHPLAGAWNYTVDSPEGVFTGVLIFAGAGEMLEGSITGEQADTAAPLEELAFDDETATATFKFDSGQYGMMDVTMKLNESDLSGNMYVIQYGADVPIVAIRAE